MRFRDLVRGRLISVSYIYIHIYIYMWYNYTGRKYTINRIIRKLFVKINRIIRKLDVFLISIGVSVNDSGQYACADSTENQYDGKPLEVYRKSE